MELTAMIRNLVLVSVNKFSILSTRLLNFPNDRLMKNARYPSSILLESFLSILVFTQLNIHSHLFYLCFSSVGDACTYIFISLFIFREISLSLSLSFSIDDLDEIHIPT